MRNLIVFQKVGKTFGVRLLSTVAVQNEIKETKRNFTNRMCGWQIHSYSDQTSELICSDKLAKPFINSPSQLLVKITASSVNPIDTAMMSTT
jgi:hypothetical protein